MKTKLLFLLAILLGFTLSCQKKIDPMKEDFSKRNKEIAARYHNLKAEDIDSILTENFIGRNEKSRFTWNRKNHRDYLTSDRFKVDSIFYQIAEGDWVATRFFRTMEYQGDTVKYEAMHFKRFENGKIAEIWEYGDTKQVDTEKK